MNDLAPYQRRVVTEKAELDEKLHALRTFFDGYVFAHLNPAEQDRMRRQAQHMAAYRDILGERIDAFMSRPDSFFDTPARGQ